MRLAQAQALASQFFYTPRLARGWTGPHEEGAGEGEGEGKGEGKGEEQGDNNNIIINIPNSISYSLTDSLGIIYDPVDGRQG